MRTRQHVYPLYAALLVLLLWFVLSTPVVAGQTPLTGPYLGQAPPGMIPEVFAPGVVSITGAQAWSTAFTPNGQQFYYSLRVGNDTDLYYMKADKRGVWRGPFPVPFRSAYIDMEPFVTNDGKKLFFSSDRPYQGVGRGRIWEVNIQKNGWSPARVAQGVVNQALSMYLTISKKGTAVYTGPGMASDSDIYQAKYRDGVFSEAVRMGPPVSTERNEAHPFIAIDESFIVLGAERDDSYGSTDLYISFRKGSNSWSSLINLGPLINTANYDSFGYVSPDRKYFFFGRQDGIYWVDARVLKMRRRTNMSCYGAGIVPPAPVRGQQILLQATARNKSNVYSMSTRLDFYLSTSKTIGPQAILLGSTDVDSLAPFKSARVSVNAMLPVTIPRGEYYLLAEVDREDWNCDPFRKNNKTYRKTRIVIR